jgi:hypothetical protein
MRPKGSLHSTVVAYLALFVAIGGTASAIGGGSSSSGDKQATAAKKHGKRGPRGPRGHRGRPGPTRVTVRGTGVVPNYGTQQATTGALASCLPGEVATGGGFSSSVTGTTSESRVIDNGPVQVGTTYPNGWVATFQDSSPGRQVYVLCAPVG